MVKLFNEHYKCIFTVMLYLFDKKCIKLKQSFFYWPLNRRSSVSLSNLLRKFRPFPAPSSSFSIHLTTNKCGEEVKNHLCFSLHCSWSSEVWARSIWTTGRPTHGWSTVWLTVTWWSGSGRRLNRLTRRGEADCYSSSQAPHASLYKASKHCKVANG